MRLSPNRRQFLATATATIAAAAGCEQRETPPAPLPAAHEGPPPIDGLWFRRSLVKDTLAHWLAASPMPNGFFQPNLDRQWRPVQQQSATLVSQSRLLFVFATGFELTQDRRYLEAVQSGGRFLLGHFRDHTYGGYFWSVSPEGQVLDTAKNSYGHAFAIFGLSHAYRVSKQPEFLESASEAWQVLKARMFDEQDGLRFAANAAFTQFSGGNSQNPIMHLFEALLALHDVTAAPDILEETRRLGEFALGRLYRADRRCIPESYNAQWKADPEDYVEMGHQAEWAFFLSRASLKGLPEEYLLVGNHLMDYCMAHGYDPIQGGLGEGAGQPGKGRWQQAEFLRALLRYASRHGRAELWEPFERSLALVKRDFIDAEYGGWVDSSTMEKGNVWKVGYHETGMYLEAIRVAEGAPAT